MARAAQRTTYIAGARIVGERWWNHRVDGRFVWKGDVLVDEIFHVLVVIFAAWQMEDGAGHITK